MFDVKVLRPVNRSPRKNICPHSYKADPVLWGLPKGLRRMLVFSETFFFREYGKAKAPKKTRQREGHKTFSSLVFCE
ncbi:MAG TPA: hypothetical protein VEC99_14515 [Clostridia bacterium]|nr:hypothetical protein [Clostridia bacterium]